METAFSKGEYGKAAQIANEYLALAWVYRCNWNYGNAVHDANRILGLISFEAGDLDKAEKYLVASGQSSGSPQLNTFGPSLELANALLKAGAQESVEKYLTDISSFWEMNNGAIKEWLVAIGRGEDVTLHRSAANAPSPFFLVLIYVLFAWPFLVTTVALLIKRQSLHAKVKFFFASVVAGYIGLVLINIVLESVVASLAANVDSSLGVTLLIYIPTLVTMSIPVVTTLFLLRFFRYPNLMR